VYLSATDAEFPRKGVTSPDDGLSILASDPVVSGHTAVEKLKRRFEKAREAQRW